MTRLASKRHGALPVGWHQSQKEGLGQSLGRQRSLQARHLPEIEPRVQQMRWRPHEASFTPCPPPILLLGQAQLNRHLLHSIRSVPGDFDPASVFLIFKHRDRDPDEAISFCLAPTQPVSSKRGLKFLNFYTKEMPFHRPASGFLKQEGRNWTNPALCFFVPVSISRIDPVWSSI